MAGGGLAGNESADKDKYKKRKKERWDNSRIWRQHRPASGVVDSNERVGAAEKDMRRVRPLAVGEDGPGGNAEEPGYRRQVEVL